MSNNNTQIFRTLDGIRGIAALLVLVRHVPLFGTWDFQKSYLAVDLFFILSGVVIANAYHKRLTSDLSPAQFVWMRIVRIYPLYLLGCAVTALYWMVTGDFPSGNIMVIAVSALLLIPNLSGHNNPFPLNGPAWSLFSEMLANILYAIFAGRLNRKMLLAIMGMSAVWMSYVIWRHHDLNVGYYTRDIVPGLCRVAYSFAAGILIQKTFCKLKLQKDTVSAGDSFVPWLILVIVTLLLTVSLHGVAGEVFDLACVTVVFPAIVLTAMIYHPRPGSAVVFKFLGLVSYPVYALHSPLAKWIPLFFDKSNIDLSTHPLPLGIAFVGVLLPLGWLLDKYYDIPVRKLALPFGLSYLAKLRNFKIPAAIR